ncbi:MAG: glycosyltransferase family 39 protein [Flavobacteriales bacterium]|nr:glycosyltransferase family 39 protein [Flavobacteriales bacterium]
MSSKLALILIFAVFVVVECLIWPITGFPLNDSWAYFQTIENFTQTGVFKTSEWQATTLLPQYILSYAISSVFGLSILKLRLINIVVGLINLILFWRILRFAKLGNLTRFFTVLILLFNPIWLNVTNTFLPESIYIFFLLTILNLQLSIIKTNGGALKTLILIVLIYIGAMQRQSTLVLSLTFLIFALWQRKRAVMIPSLITFCASITLLLISQSLFSKYLPASLNYQLQSIFIELQNTLFESFKKLVYYSTNAVTSLGVLTIPLTVILIGNIKRTLKKNKNLSIWVFLVCVSLVILKIIFSNNSFPFTGNIVHELGTGPLIFTGYNTQEIDQSLTLYILGFSLSLLGITNFSAISVVVWNRLKSRNKGHTSFIIITAILYCLPFCFSYFNDRYLVFPLMLFLILISLQISQKKYFERIIIGLIFLSPIAIYSTLTNHDYFAIHRSKTDLIHKIASSQSDMKQIDAGFEHNAYFDFNFQSYLRCKNDRWWWTSNKKSIISPVHRFNGYKNQYSSSVKTWWPLSPKFIYYHEKLN